MNVALKRLKQSILPVKLLILEEPVKHQWRIRRQTSPKLDGQQRWDRAYQFLLQWSQAQPQLLTCPLVNPTQEVLYDNDSGRLRQGFDPKSGPSAND